MSPETAIGLAVAAALLIALLQAAIKILPEYQRGVLFRLGRVTGPPRGPGLVFIIPIVDRLVRVSLRTVTLDIPPQDIITKDNVTVRVNAVAYFHVVDANKAILEIEDFNFGTSQVAQTTLRSIIGQAELDELLVNRDEINRRLQQIIDEQTDRRLGRQGDAGRGQGRRTPRLDAPGHGGSGRIRARTARQGDPRPGRRGGRTNVGRSSKTAGGPSRSDAAPGSPDHVRGLHREDLDPHLPPPHGVPPGARHAAAAGRRRLRRSG